MLTIIVLLISNKEHRLSSQTFKIKGFFCLLEQNKATELFFKLLDQLFHVNKPGSFSFFSDNLFTFGKTLGFLEEKKFAETANKHCVDDVSANQVIWRTHTLCWAANNALNLKGDFVELGAYQGATVHFICDYTDLEKYNKQYFVYDVFQNPPSHAMDEHSDHLYDDVVKRFKNYPYVNIIKGLIPDSFNRSMPDKISLLHVDLNHAESEIKALEILFERVVPGGYIILDDYGWSNYKEQYTLEYEFFEKKNLKVLELPTGQGLVIKHDTSKHAS